MTTGKIILGVIIVGVALSIYNIREIKNTEDDIAAWWAQVDANNNPGAGSYIKAFFDGATLGALSNGDAFAEYHRIEQANQQLEATRLVLVKRYNDEKFYRNLGFLLAAAGVVAGILMKKNAVRLQPSNHTFAR
jgi:hypothetical protein